MVIHRGSVNASMTAFAPKRPQPDDSPYSVSSATRTASSAPVTRTMGFTGPKDSSA